MNHDLEIPTALTNNYMNLLKVINKEENLGVIVIAFAAGRPPCLSTNLAEAKEFYKVLQWMIDNKDEAHEEVTEVRKPD